MNLDKICRQNTGFTSFADLLNSFPSYRPSLDMREEWARHLADAYDAAMAERGDARRAYRYAMEAYEAAKAKQPTPLQRAKAAVADAYAEAKREIRLDPQLRRLRWCKGRGRPMYAIDANGERLNDGGWIEFNGTWKPVQQLINRYPEAVKIWVDGGIDCAENLEAMQCFDYETVRYGATIWER